MLRGAAREPLSNYRKVAALVSLVSLDPLEGRTQKWSARVRRVLPTGLSLPDDVWKARHRGIVILLSLHVPAVFAFGTIRGFGPLHMLLESGVIAAFPAAAW